MSPGQKLTEQPEANLIKQGILKGEVSITVPMTSCLTGLDYSVLQIKTKIITCHTADSKPVKLEVNGTVILPTLVFLVSRFYLCNLQP